MKNLNAIALFALLVKINYSPIRNLEINFMVI